MKIQVKYIFRPSIVLAFLLNCIFTNCIAQEDFGTGLLYDEAIFEREVEMAPTISNEGRRAGDLPRWFSLRPYTPIPKHQGKINSCVGWAMGYGALTTQHAYRKGRTDRKKITANAFSAMYIYNQVKAGSCNAGAYVNRAADLLKKNGDCKSSAFDYPYSDCDREPEEKVIEKSKQFAIKDFVAIFNAKSSPKTKVTRTKRSIAEGKPVVIGMQILESFKKVSKDNPIWAPQKDQDKKLGGHALAVIGYNDSLGIFEIMNSWGNQWGDRGFFFMSYKDFSEQVFQGIQLVLPEEKLTPKRKKMLVQRMEKAASEKSAAQLEEKELESKIKKAQQLADQNPTPEKQKEIQLEIENTQQQIQKNIVRKKVAELELEQTEERLISLAGDFEVRVPITDEFGTAQQDEDGNFLFEKIETTRNGNFYTLNKKDWEEGDMFQVIANNIRQDRYVYVFSLDGNNKSEIHFPRNERFKSKGEKSEIVGAGESALISHSGAEIIIPGNDRVLTRENLLEDNICVLYSFNKIENFGALVQKIQEAEGAFEERVNVLLQDLLIPSSFIEFGTNQMSCKTETTGLGSIIPIILKIQNE